MNSKVVQALVRISFTRASLEKAEYALLQYQKHRDDISLRIAMDYGKEAKKLLQSLCEDIKTISDKELTR